MQCLQDLQRARDARADSRVPYVADSNFYLWAPGWVGLGLPRGAQAAALTNRARRPNSDDNVLADSASFWLSHYEIGVVPLAAVLSHILVLIRIYDEYGSRLTKKYVMRFLDCLRERISRGEHFDLAAAISVRAHGVWEAVDSPVARPPRCGRSSVVDDFQPSTAMANRGDRPLTTGPVAASADVSFGVVATRTPSQPPGEPLAATAKRRYLCLNHDPANSLICGDPQCNKVHLDTTISNNAERLARATAPFNHYKMEGGETIGCGSCHESMHIEATAVVASMAAVTNDNCMSCHVDGHSTAPDANVPAGAEIAATDPHIVSGLDCTSCHDIHESDRRHLLIADAETMCQSCHVEGAASIAGLDVPADIVALTAHDPHFTAEDTGCLDCHAMHGEGLEKLVKLAEPELCTTCHDQTSGFPHGDEEKGANCSDCHKMHVDVEGMLVAEQPALCLDCHDNVQPHTTAAAFFHPVADEEVDCASCHSVHNDDPHLLIDDKLALCASCHESVAADPMLAGFQHPVGGEFVDCNACHASIHNTNAEEQHMTQNRCLTCHPGPHSANMLERDPHGESDVSCFGCHQVHANDHHKLLKGEESELCLDCHAEVTGDFFLSFRHPVTDGVVKCSDCHEQLFQSHQQHEYAGFNGACLECHGAFPRAVSVRASGGRWLFGAAGWLLELPRRAWIEQPAHSGAAVRQ